MLRRTKYDDAIVHGVLAALMLAWVVEDLVREGTLDWRPVVACCAFLVCVFQVYKRDKRDPRWRKGHCRKCGYDLACNESGVCPECGEAI